MNNNLLKLAIEIESLTALLTLRGDEAPEITIQMLHEKIEELTDALGNFNSASLNNSATISSEKIAESAEEEQMDDADVAPAQQTTSMSLNDKFKFQRELFNNDPTELQAAIDITSAMKGIDEIEEYLYNDLCLDPQNETTIEFVDLLKSKIK